MVNTPKYQKIILDITEKIRNGVFLPGRQIEQVSSLCEIYQLSHVTVLRALRELAETGVLLRKPGIGYFVSELQEEKAPSCVGCFVRNLWPRQLDNYTNEIFCGIQQELARRRLNIMQIPQLGDALQREELPGKEEIVRLIRQINPYVSGFIFDPRFDDDTVETILRHTGKPGVIIQRSSSLAIPCVIPEIPRTVEALFRLLLKMNYHNFLFLEFGYDVPTQNELAAVWEDERKKLPPECRCRVIHNSCLLPQEQFRECLAVESAELLKTGRTAVICCGDNTAREVVNILDSKGVHVPEDAGVVGFYGLADAMWFKPNLSTLKINTFAIGTTAAGLLADEIAGVKKFPPVVHRIKTEFVPGETI